MSDTIRVIVFSDCDQWVAQCLEYDIGAQAPDLDTLRARLSVALDMELTESIRQNDAPFAGIEPAPQRFHDMWEHRSRAFGPESIMELSGAGRPVSVNMGLAA